MNTIRWTAIVALIVLAAIAQGADENWPTTVHRIVGLCYPERVEDLKAEFKEIGRAHV